LQHDRARREGLHVPAAGAQGRRARPGVRGRLPGQVRRVVAARQARLLRERREELMKTYVLTVREQHESMSLGLKLKTYREEVVESDDRRQPLQRIIEVVDEIGGPYAWNRCVRDRRRKNVFRYVLP